MDLQKTFAFLLLLFGISALTLTSCNKCRKNGCVNGTCMHGECDCHPGWEGEACDEAYNQKFAGVWNVTDFCVPNYQLEIIALEDPFEMLIVGLHGVPTDSIAATVVFPWIDFSVPVQACTPLGFTIEGNAVLNGNGSVSINYNTNDLNNQPDDICLATLRR